LGVITSISRYTRGNCGNPPAVGAGDVGEGGGMVTVQLEAIKRERRGRGRFGRDRVDLAFYPLKLQKSACCGCRRCGRRRGDGQRTAGSRKTRVEGQRAGLRTITSISSSICGTCRNPPAMGAGDVGGEGGMVSVQLEAVKQEWRARGPVWA
jgi:hypothetical protein